RIAQTIPIVFPAVRFRPHRFHVLVESNQRHGITSDSYHSTSLWTDTLKAIITSAYQATVKCHCHHLHPIGHMQLALHHCDVGINRLLGQAKDNGPSPRSLRMTSRSNRVNWVPMISANASQSDRLVQ
ncbi:hypothetical protein, partial [Hoeflea sp.]|uniref:hypothetical protein n=1 Tax=Hoeflea sp. TaxID=1940281 RepID=UPI0025BD3E94